jgi:hypothetical protein
MSFSGEFFPKRELHNGDKVFDWRKNRIDSVHQESLKVEDGVITSEIDSFPYKNSNGSMDVQVSHSLPSLAKILSRYIAAWFGAFDFGIPREYVAS